MAIKAHMRMSCFMPITLRKVALLFNSERGLAWLISDNKAALLPVDGGWGEGWGIATDAA